MNISSAVHEPVTPAATSAASTTSAGERRAARGCGAGSTAVARRHAITGPMPVASTSSSASGTTNCS